MNCSQYQEQLLVDPDNTDAGLSEHIRKCPACAAYAVRQERFQAQLRDAFEVPVPRGLAPRQLVAASFARTSSASNGIRPLYALAASILLVLFVAASLLPRFTNSLEAEVLAELAHDRDQRATGAEIEQVKLQSVLAPAGVELRTALLRKVMFAELCDVAKRKAAHIMLAGDIAPVSALLMPGQLVATRSTLDDGQITGILTPIPGGSLAIAGRPGEPIAQIEADLLSSLRIRHGAANEL